MMKKILFFLFTGIAIWAGLKMYVGKKNVKSQILPQKSLSFDEMQKKLNTLDSLYSIQQADFTANLLNKYANITQQHVEIDTVVFFHEKDSAKFIYTLNVQPFFEKNVLKAHILWQNSSGVHTEKMQCLYECHRGKWSEIYGDYEYNCIKFADVNGDNYQDVLIQHRPSCGHSMHNWVEVLLYNPIKKAVVPASTREPNKNYLSNPTFFPKKGIALCNQTCNPTVTHFIYQVKFKNYKWHFVEAIHIPYEDDDEPYLCDNKKYRRCTKELADCKECPVIKGLPKLYEKSELFEERDSVFFAIK